MQQLFFLIVCSQEQNVLHFSYFLSDRTFHLSNISDYTKHQLTVGKMPHHSYSWECDNNTSQQHTEECPKEIATVCSETPHFTADFPLCFSKGFGFLDRLSSGKPCTPTNHKRILKQVCTRLTRHKGNTAEGGLRSTSQQHNHGNKP